MFTVGFTGSRSLPQSFASLVASVVGAVIAGGGGVAVGCAAGADSFVRSACPSAHVFRASSFGAGRGSFAQRSAAVVGASAAVVGFAAGRCPVGLVPSSSSAACFGGFGSGTWATLALAAGQGLPVAVFLCGSAAALPVWPGGAWVGPAFAGPWPAAVPPQLAALRAFGAWAWVPSQLALF